MARDYENIFNLDNMDDDELVGLIRQELAEYDTIDADNILVTVEDGVVLLAGRVGTESERRIAEHVLTDVIGVTDYENNLVVDPIRRDEEPEAVDEHVAVAPDQDDTAEVAPDSVTGPEAEHLEEDLEARLYGTHDMQSAIERGTAWEPPHTPTPEGLAGMEPDAPSLGEDH